MPEREGDKRRVAVLISGRGSNMKAIVEQAHGYEVALVASNKPLAPGLAWARVLAIRSWTWDSRGVDKVAWEGALQQSLDDHRIGTIALAGFMRILSPAFTRRWVGRVLNIHPSLLPKYRGLDTHKRAIEAGDPMSGCSVHLVTEELDSGEILAQAEVPIVPGDSEVTLEARILEAEHRLYPKAVAEFVRR
jgi:phosphoribosylglycinamide formyltransferase-1